MPTTATPPVTEEVRNGVPVTRLLATRKRLTAEPELAQFRFTAKNRWEEGFVSQTSISDWYGVGADQQRPVEYTYRVDHPSLGTGQGPTPQEMVLHALASCLTAGVATNAAARGIDLQSVTSVVSGELDVRGVLGIREEQRDGQSVPVSVRPGFDSITIDFEIEGDADEATLAKLAESSRRTSAVYDMLTADTPVHISVNS